MIVELSALLHDADRLNDMLNTDSAKKIGQHRHEVLESYLKELREEL